MKFSETYEKKFRYDIGCLSSFERWTKQCLKIAKLVATIWNRLKLPINA